MDLHVGGRWEDLSRLQDYDVRGYGSAFPRDNIPEIQIRARGFLTTDTTEREHWVTVTGSFQAEGDSTTTTIAQVQ